MRSPPETDQRRELHARVVTLHLDVADSVARRYHGRGPDHQDLVQVARVGLVEAANRFEAARGSFLAFAIPTMTGDIKRYSRDHAWTVRPPRSLQERQADVTQAERHLTQTLRHHPTRFSENAVDSDEAFQRVDVLVTIRTACRQLSAEDRHLLYLRFFANCSQQEIADQYGASQRQISRRLLRIFQQLKETLGDL